MIPLFSWRRIALAVSVACSASVSAAPHITVSTSTTQTDGPLTDQHPTVFSLGKNIYKVSVSGLDGECEATSPTRVKFNTPIPLSCQAESHFEVNIRFAGDYGFYFEPSTHTLSIKREPKKTATVFKRPLPDVQCQVYRGGPVTLSVGEAFADGTQLTEALSGQVVRVRDHQVTLTPASNSGGLILLAPTEREPQAFTYRNANIYFVMVDRFHNGDPSNDHSYGRHSDNQQNIGTFHGGDLQGVLEKLDYIQSLGTDVIWLSPIVEQVHGFVGGGSKGAFPFYAYHGYWARDFTQVDQNFGDDAVLKKLVEAAHQRGMKVFLDAVLNHPGYATLADLQQDGIKVVNADALPAKWQDWHPKKGQSWHDFHQAVDYQSANWQHWWGKDWVRAGLPGYDAPGSSDQTLTLAGLPDFKTESTKSVTPPQWLLDNPGTRVKVQDGYTVSDYLLEWQTQWVERFGIDGFRVDTVKHVDGEIWRALKQKASAALASWRQKHQQSGAPFWMMGEVWGHSAYRSPYFDQGFDALINFDLQKQMDKGAYCLSQMEETYNAYAQTMQNEADFIPVSYMSSHDTELFFSRFKDMAMQRGAANALLLSPGAIQVYYGDEVGRDLGPYGDDFHQGTRSDMVWSRTPEQQRLLAHWRKVAQFRQQHPAVGAGIHRAIAQDNAYVFSRQLGDDTIVAAFVGRTTSQP
ncbi:MULTISPECIES: alpha-amylase [unclassified Salinivibrio]|uniref:alpha-amylase n=1 Tax=unclassified Salinivibrio TaxID=2636825 RepID=UPI00098784EB|nr:MULTISPECIES: alpha-amylase [unclassified Salinivibrio]OOF15595.1 alpha-amylase [Salinivibrio sp. PR919]OOF19468.1 alpha-amylase [Salinivibrio sp. PR932]